MSLLTDANGIVQEGRFAGRHIDEVERWIEGLEAAVTDPSREAPIAPATPEKKELTAAEKLAAANAQRLDPLQMATLQRLEQDDEQQFRGQVEDYDVYADKINKLKATLHPAQRAQKNLHRTLYINVKGEDKRVAARIFAKVEEEKPALPEDEDEDPLPSPGVDTPSPIVAKPALRTVKPAPPMAAPTSATRKAEPKAEKKAKLVPTDKLREFCRRTGQDINAYMLRLEDAGETQESVNNAGQLGRREQPRSVYDRPRAKR